MNSISKSRNLDWTTELLSKWIRHCYPPANCQQVDPFAIRLDFWVLWDKPYLVKSPSCHCLTTPPAGPIRIHQVTMTMMTDQLCLWRGVIHRPQERSCDSSACQGWKDTLARSISVIHCTLECWMATDNHCLFTGRRLVIHLEWSGSSLLASHCWGWHYRKSAKLYLDDGSDLVSICRLIKCLPERSAVGETFLYHDGQRLTFY